MEGSGEIRVKLGTRRRFALRDPRKGRTDVA